MLDRLWVDAQGRDVTAEDVKDAILQLTVTEHYYTGVQDLVTLLCEFNGITVKVWAGLNSSVSQGIQPDNILQLHDNPATS